MTHTSTLVNEHKHYMDKSLLREQLPKVGDIRWEIMTIDKTGDIKTAEKPQRCRVIEVNRAHLWYLVQFENGFRESYKLPRPKSAGGAAK